MDIWEFIIIMVEIMYFLNTYQLLTLLFQDGVGVIFVFSQGQVVVSRIFMVLTIPWNFLICVI